MPRNKGYEHAPAPPDYRLFPSEKPFCLLVLSGVGEFEETTVRIVADYVGELGLRLVLPDWSPALAVCVKAGDGEGQVLQSREAIDQCKRLVEGSSDQPVNDEATTVMRAERQAAHVSDSHKWQYALNIKRPINENIYAKTGK